MAEVLVLSGAGRFADPWHPFAQTSERLAGLLTELGHRVETSADVEERLADLDGIDLLVLNAGNPTTLGLADTTELTAAARAGLLGYLERGGPLLSMHISVNSLPGIPEWPDIVGGSWVQGHSMHPPHGHTTVDVHPECHPIVADLQDFSLVDERYSHLVVAPDVVPLVSHVHDDIRHPLFWARTYGRARVVYDALGHGAESYDAPGHRELLTAAVRWLTSGPTMIN